MGFPYMLWVGSEFPDVIVLDENGERKSIKFEQLYFIMIDFLYFQSAIDCNLFEAKSIL